LVVKIIPSQTSFIDFDKRTNDSSSMKKLISPAAAAPAVLGPMISSSCAYYYCFFLFLFTVVSRSSWAWKHDSPTSAFVTTIPLTTTKKGSAYSSDSALLVPSCLLLPKSSSRRRRRSSLLSPLPSTVFTAQDGSSSSKDNNEDATDDKQQQQEQEQQEQVVITTDSPIIKPSSYLDQNLTNDERSIVNIVRTRSPSVACVSSFSIPTRSNNRKKRNRPSSTSSPGKSNQELPVGSVSLGSGSAFAISSDGYLITNYHVIERAYQIQQTSIRLEEFQTNITKALKSSFPPCPFYSTFPYYPATSSTSLRLSQILFGDQHPLTYCACITRT
jgi:Trypsin-like serine proteases, typically periplasmic, contain C-terminal PDZ domain